MAATARTNRRPRRSEAGSALVEATIVGAALVPAIAGFLAVAYLQFARAWTRHSAYEAAICAARREGDAACERRLRGVVAGVLPIGRVTAARVRSAPHEARASIRFELAACAAGTTCFAAEAARVVALPLGEPLAAPARKGRR